MNVLKRLMVRFAVLASITALEVWYKKYRTARRFLQLISHANLELRGA